jgi:hypothetical protein
VSSEFEEIRMADAKSPLAGSGADASSDRRRTHRLQITMPVIVRGKLGNHPFEEQTRTASVNANGCMVHLAAQVTRSQHVSIINPKTAEELPCKVTFIGQRDGKKIEIGLEFIEPSPLFWRIAFPPEDWDPSERKRASAPRPGSKR